jgi:site-specific recombinase XerD
LLESGKAVIQYLKEMERWMDWMVKVGELKRSPFPMDLLPRITKVRKEPPKLSDVLELIDKEVETPLQIRNALMVRLLYLTGMRPKSLSRIRLDDLAESGIWIIKKGGKKILQPIGTDEMNMILQYVQWVLPRVTVPSHENSELYLFPSYRGRKMENSSISLIFKLQLKTKLTPYSLRHGVAQGMWNEGCSSDEVIEVLGHGDLFVGKGNQLLAGKHRWEGRAYDTADWLDVWDPAIWGWSPHTARPCGLSLRCSSRKTSCGS